MDWYLDGRSAADVSVLRHEVMSYLRRHCAEDSDLDAAELVFAEVVGNVPRHAGGPSWVSLTWPGTQPTLTVYDLGPGFDPHQLEGAGDAPPVAVAPPTMDESGRGLFLVSHLASGLHTRAREHGSVVTVTLPVNRPPSVSHDPPQHRVGVLPSLEEAQPEGGFGRESFLRALVVQLAQTLELQHGPDAADAAVAQVGTDVGSQMEAEFRAAAELVGRMSPQQMSLCYVRLKHAIDGDFYVIEADEHKIVLGNRRCPFGEVVKQAPSLCRMTSSVFGGIAARNSSDGGAAVLLEERIAVGDPGCRVTVFLSDAEDPPPEAHRYAGSRPRDP